MEKGRNFQLKCLNSFYKCKIVYYKRNEITWRCQNVENNLIKGYFGEIIKAKHNIHVPKIGYSILRIIYPELFALH